MAGHYEGLAVNAVDALGMAQKGGGVYSHIRMSPSPEAVVSARVGSGGADTVLTNDIVLAHSETILPLMSPDKTRVVANHRILPTADMIGARDARHARESMRRQIEANSSSFTVLDADRVVREELGDPIFANMCLLGSAWQRGHIPIGLASIVRAMEEVGVKVKQNRRAFELGRQMALDEGMASVKTIARKSLSIDEFIDKRAAELVAYQDRAYAERFRATLRPLQTANAQADSDLVRIAAENLFKLMAYKDEYEVARLYASDEYRQTLRSNFSGRYKVRLHMAPPLFARKKEDGTLQKMKLPSFFFRLMPLLAAGKRLRGSWADPFGRTEERKMERALRDEYIEQIARLAGNLSQVNEDAARRLLAAPRLIRGYGHIKAASVEDYKVEVREAEAGLVSQCGTPKKTRLIARG